jgi:hypothetical protein
VTISVLTIATEHGKRERKNNDNSMKCGGEFLWKILEYKIKDKVIYIRIITELNIFK